MTAQSTSSIMTPMCVQNIRIAAVAIIMMGRTIVNPAVTTVLRVMQSLAIVIYARMKRWR